MAATRSRITAFMFLALAVALSFGSAFVPNGQGCSSPLARSIELRKPVVSKDVHDPCRGDSSRLSWPTFGSYALALMVFVVATFTPVQGAAARQCCEGRDKREVFAGYGAIGGGLAGFFGPFSYLVAVGTWPVTWPETLIVATFGGVLFGTAGGYNIGGSDGVDCDSAPLAGGFAGVTAGGAYAEVGPKKGLQDAVGKMMLKKAAK